MKKKIASIAFALALSALTITSFADEDTVVQDLEQRITILEEKVAFLEQLLGYYGETESPEDTSGTESPDTASEDIPLNTMVTIGNWDAKVTGLEFSPTYDAGFGSYSASEGEKYAIVHMSVTNNGTTAETFLTNQSFSGDGIKSKLFYQEKYEFGCANFLTADNDLNTAYIEPLAVKNGDVIFAVSDTIEESPELFYMALSLNGTDYNFLFE